MRECIKDDLICCGLRTDDMIGYEQKEYCKFIMELHYTYLHYWHSGMVMHAHIGNGINEWSNVWIVIVNEWGFSLYKFVAIRIIGFLFSFISLFFYSTKLEIMMKGITKKKKKKKKEIKCLNENENGNENGNSNGNGNRNGDDGNKNTAFNSTVLNI